LFSIVKAVGWPIWPLILASVVALALIIERAIALKRGKVVPPDLQPELLGLISRRQVTVEVITRLERHSPLGRVLATALRSAHLPRSLAAENVASTGGRTAHDLSRHLSMLGSIGSVAPLLGLLGTVVGMIEIFASQQAGSNPQQLASGISIALYSTAFGIIVAVPAVMFYRHFKARVEEYVVTMEEQAERLLDAIYTPQ
jgi:biopolymer transport protein ExbB